MQSHPFREGLRATAPHMLSADPPKRNNSLYFSWVRSCGLNTTHLDAALVASGDGKTVREVVDNICSEIQPATRLQNNQWHRSHINKTSDSKSKPIEPYLNRSWLFLSKFFRFVFRAFLQYIAELTVMFL